MKQISDKEITEIIDAINTGYVGVAVRTLELLLEQPEQRKCGLCGEDKPFTGTCGGGKENPSALCFALSVSPEQELNGKTFHAKFNVGDHVWYMHKNKPTEVIISSIKIFYVSTNQDRITYSAEDVLHSISWLDHPELLEDWLYSSKIELLEAL